MIAICELFRTMREMSTRFMGNLLHHHYFIFFAFSPSVFETAYMLSLVSASNQSHNANREKKKTTQSKQYKCSLRPSKNTLRFQVICLKIQTHKKKEKDLDRSSRPFSGSDFFSCIYRFFKVKRRHMLW